MRKDELDVSICREGCWVLEVQELVLIAAPVVIACPARNGALKIQVGRTEAIRKVLVLSGESV